MQKYIENEYERKTGNYLKNIPRYNYQEFIIYENEHAKKFRKFVEINFSLSAVPPRHPPN